MPVVAMAEWHPIWDGPLTRDLEAVPTLADADNVRFNGMIAPMNYYAWDTFMAFAERYYSATETNPALGYARSTNLWRVIAGSHYNSTFPVEYGLTNVFYQRWFDPLPVLKSAVWSLSANYTSKPLRDLFGGWNGWFSTATFTNPITGEKFYPTTIPTLQGEFSSYHRFTTNIPPNFFAVTPPRGIDAHGEGITNFPGILPGYTSKDYGWPGLRRFIRLMDEHFINSPLARIHWQEGQLTTDDGSPPFFSVTNRVGALLVLNGFLGNQARGLAFENTSGQWSVDFGSYQIDQFGAATSRWNQVHFVRESTMIGIGRKAWSASSNAPVGDFPIVVNKRTNSWETFSQELRSFTRPNFSTTQLSFSLPSWFSRELVEIQSNEDGTNYEIPAQLYEERFGLWLVRPDFRYK